MSVHYEWCYEEKDRWGDVINLDREERLKSFHLTRITDTLCLIRYEGSEAKGMTEQSWAYVEGGKLPQWFRDSAGNETHKVPMRFHTEFLTTNNQ